MENRTIIKHAFILVLVAGLTSAYYQPQGFQKSTDANEWLNKMADAVIAPGTTVETITTEMEQTIMSPMGEITISGTSTMNFETGDQNAVLETPQGTVEVIIEDGKGMQKVGGQEIPMNNVQLQQVKTEMERTYISVAMNKDSFDAEYLGTETIDDTEYAKLQINFTVPVTYYLDTETSLPSMLKFTQFNQQTGGEIEIEVRHSDWQTVSGVTYAFTTETYADGTQAGSGTVKSLKVNE
jgi:hypothetical protein